MIATVGAALKKIAVSLFADKKVLKVTGGIALGIIIIIAMPIVAVVSIFNGDVEIDYSRLDEIIVENMDESDRENLELSESVLAELETKMTEAGFESRIQGAQTLYLLGLVDRGGEEGFSDTLVGCFAEEQTDEELIVAVNETFGSTITLEDFTRAMEKYRTQT